MRDPWSAIVAELFRQIQTFSRGDADRAPTYKGDPTGFEEPAGGHRECRSAESPNAATSMEGEDDRLKSYSVPALPRRQAHDRLALRCVRLSRRGRLRRRERWHRARPTDARRRNDYAGFAARRSVQPSAIHSGRAWRDHAESVPGRRRRRFDLSQRRCCLAPRSSSRSKTRTMAGGAFAVATPRATSGTLALMIPGKSLVRRQWIRPASKSMAWFGCRSEHRILFTALSNAACLKRHWGNTNTAFLRWVRTDIRGALPL